VATDGGQPLDLPDLPVEIAIRLLAHWPHLGRFLRDGWNVFDLAVVAASLLPQAGAFAMVARLARLMRVTRLISVLNNLESAKVELQAGEDRRSPHHAVLESIEVVKAARGAGAAPADGADGGAVGRRGILSGERSGR
jgi:hypothetical protein